jgi:uncharacterized protein (TIGR03790 family)
MRLAPSPPSISLMYRRIVCLLLLLQAGPSVAQDNTRSAAAHAARIDPTTIAVIVNAADPLSLSVGEYYARRRHIPASNVIRVSFATGAAEMSVQEFLRVKTQIDAAIPRNVQAYALTWTAPYRVGCMSITSAFAFGFDRSYCADSCTPTRFSPYFDSPSLAPAFDLHMRPAMMLAGRGLPEIKALIDRGIASDGASPRGTAYLLLTTDKARATRVLMYPAAESSGDSPIHIEILKQDVLEHRSDVMFYFTGLASVAGLDTLRFLPGAVADHLTSFGGMLTDSRQMSALKWLEAGATGSYGTVVEPCNFPQKFSDPAVVIAHYLRGETLIEAYWKSVAWPGQGVFVGEPLAAPFRRSK